MKNLTPCPDCGRQVSKNAFKCPGCGAEVNTGTWLAFAVMMCIGVAMIVAMILAFFIV